MMIFWTVGRREIVGFVLVIMVLSVAIIGYHLQPKATWTSVPLASAVSGKKIAIDAGHGGVDPGAVGVSGVLEKEISLAIAQKLQAHLSRVSVYTLMIREDDYDLADEDLGGFTARKKQDLVRRADMANEAGVDLYISIHANAFPGASWSGAQTFYNPGSEQGKSLAVAVQAELVRHLGPNRRQAKPGDFRVLNNTTMPGTLVEVGFLSNPREESNLRDPEYQEKVAYALFMGIVRYFSEEYLKGQNQASSVPPVREERREPFPPEMHADEILLYFAGASSYSDNLVGEVRRVEATGTQEEHLRDILLQLIRGPGEGSALFPTLPKTTKIKRVQRQGEVVIVDLGPEILVDHWKGGRSEELAIYSIVNTLTRLPGVTGVQILIDGQVETLAGHIVLDKVLRRRVDLIDGSERLP